MSYLVRPGRIILLNGTSSSGKSSIAAELLIMLDGPYFYLSVDAINSMRAREKTLELDQDQLAAVLARTRAGFHRVVAGMAQAGNDVIADHVLSERWRLLDCLEVMAGLEVVFVGVHCSAAQLRQVHSYGSYDIECDTTAASPRDCAETIRDFLAAGIAPVAFDRLRALLLP
jgi:chloramphenicol 3-O phosphotransferase